MFYCVLLCFNVCLLCFTVFYGVVRCFTMFYGVFRWVVEIEGKVYVCGVVGGGVNVAYELRSW